jgi:two-component system response regulator AtoC
VRVALLLVGPVPERDRKTEGRILVNPQDRPRLSLLVMSERGVFTYPLPEEGIVRIGRAEQCEVTIADAQLSREHARLLVGDVVEIVDLGSSNGTRLGGEDLVPNYPVPLPPGDVVSMGGTVLILQRSSAERRPRQLWSHGYFESRLEEECARAEQRKTTFAVLRVKFDPQTAPGVIESRLSAGLRPDHVVGSYAPGEYEVLLTDLSPDDAEREAQRLMTTLSSEGLSPEIGIACYPRDGHTPEALLAISRHRPSDSSKLELPAGGSLTRLRSIAERFAAGNIPVLVLGETGVGKDVLSAMIHRLSRRAANPYVCINCAALPEALLESELFGYERGAFTGAIAAKAGLLESARGGTVFLDEVAEMPLAAQAKLLRVLDQGEVLRLGATRPRAIDVRFIGATNRDLELEVERGRFREDLYFRLAAAAIVIPPLRERVAEIAPLARTFVRKACRDLSRPRVPRILPEALALLEQHSWPGNIRELRNAMERAVLLANDADIGVAQLPKEKMGRKLRTPGVPFERRSEQMRQALGRVPDSTRPPSIPPPDPLATTVAASRRSTAPPLHVNARVTEMLARDPEAAKLLAVLDACEWNQTKAALELGISRRTLVSRLSAYGLTRKRQSGKIEG